MELKLLKPRLALNKAFLKVKPSRPEIELFKTNLIRMIDTINESESEEFHKNEVSDFLKNTYYSGSHFINTKGRNDLVIHNGASATSTVGVIVEAKKPANKAEMLKANNLNTKAFQELVLYYLRERIIHKNLEIKHLIATNIYEWFVFDAHLFEKLFAQNKALVKQFIDFEEKRAGGANTDFFYTQIAAPAIEAIQQEVSFAHFDIRDYEKPLRNNNPKDDNLLIALYKLLSPQHLLKQPFANDSNSLDKAFYSELLHIIGLTETKEGGKKLIQRKPNADRNAGSLLENTIMQLDSHDKLARILKLSQYGNNNQEQLFGVALELVITWINRVLFLKLLEAQLVAYNKGNKDFLFLNNYKIRDFDDLDKLFFRVLAKRPLDRDEKIQQLFGHVPYLNSSLFEPTELEHQTLFVSGLEDYVELPFLTSTVLKDASGKKVSKPLDTLQYLFGFLDAYNFSSEGSEEIQEDNKRLINASVLGLIFEKINGYKDGSFFTPGFITMYMCRETIRRAVLQKFNDAKGWNCKDVDELREKITDSRDANEIINSLKICDPAVGSGHFLVSALNEIIALKSELNILLDRTGRRLKDYAAIVVNDNLEIYEKESDEEFFYLKPSPKREIKGRYMFGSDSFTIQSANISERQLIQETLFHEKQTIIENCLFGVDINPNSVKICRLRLWIELLKNAYYKTPDYTELETLPNIDINIKCGNSLISRYALDADFKIVLKNSNWSIESYRKAVATYRNAKSKDEKRQMERLILGIKQEISSEIRRNNPLLTKINKLAHDISNRFTGNFLFEPKELYGKGEKELEKKRIAAQKKKEAELAAFKKEFDDIKNNKIYENSFEWRFEFPEVLNDDGDFLGFDVVIGNPPYGVKFTEQEKSYFKELYSEIHVRTPESFNYFWGLTSKISNTDGLCSFITPSSFLSQIEFEKTRKLILYNFFLYNVINLGDDVFDDVATPTCIIGYRKSEFSEMLSYSDISGIQRSTLSATLGNISKFIDASSFKSNDSYSFVFKQYKSILEKCYKFLSLKDTTEDVATGVSPGLGEAFVVTEDEVNKKQLENELIKKLIIGGEINRFYLKPEQNKRLIYCTSNTKLSEFSNIENHLTQFKSKLENRVETISGTIPWFVMLRPRRQKLFENPKILIRQTANKIMAAYDEDKWYCLKSGLIVQLPENSELHYYYLLALLNSKLLDFLYHDLVNEDNRIFPEVKPIQLFKLPIYKASKEEQLNIVSKVQSIIDLKVINADTTTLEAEIDQLVYELYGLTEDEIRIVEGEK